MKLEYIQIGTIVNAHGIRGEIRVQPIRQEPKFLTQFHTFYLDGKPVRPTANHVHKNCVLLKLPVIDDMNAALALKGKILSIKRSDATFGPFDFFDEELINIDVFDAEDGSRLGKITQVETYPSSKVYTIRGSHTYLVPAIPDVFIQSIDLDRNRMEIHRMEGLATDEN